MSNLYQANAQWRLRPDDQRVLTLDEMEARVRSRKERSWTSAQLSESIRIDVDQNTQDINAQDLRIMFEDRVSGAPHSLQLTNHAFNQLSAYAGAPAGYLAKLPAVVASLNLNIGMRLMPQRNEGLILAEDGETIDGETGRIETMRSITSTSYGRIWDLQVVQAVQRVNQDGRWQVPASTTFAQSPLQSTTLYLSDRDSWIFLVDQQNAIEVPGESHPLYRGFIVFNSEVGDKVFGLMTFLFRTVCSNRIIWDARDVRELRIRHTGGAPERFATEGRRQLMNYAEASTVDTVRGITAAKQKDIPISGDFRTMNARDQQKAVVDYMAEKLGFTRSAAQSSVDMAVAEEGQCRTMWDIVNGVTAFSRTIPHTDKRVELEQKAGKLMDRVA